MSFRTVRLIALPTFVWVAGVASAGPPFRTDDPDVGVYRQFELNLFFQQTLVADGRDGVGPSAELNYGALENLQLHLMTPIAFTIPSGEAVIRGFGDTELGVKFRLAKETDDTPAVALSALVDIPTGDSKKGLGNGGSQVFLPLWLSKRWGRFQTYGGGGYWINNGPDWKNYWFFGWQAQYDFSDHWTLGGEVFYNTGQQPGQRSSTGFNIGGLYSLDEHNSILFSAGKGLRNAAQTNRVSSYLAYSITF